MKKTNKFWSIMMMLVVTLFSAFSFTSCKEDDPELTVDRSEITFEGAGGTIDLNIYANKEAGNWTIKSDKSWVQLSFTQGTENKTVKVSAKKNETTNPLDAVLTINSAAGVQMVYVHQESGDGSLTVTPRKITMPASGGIQNININSNTSWTISGTNDWCKVSAFSGEGSKTIAINVESYKEVEHRSNSLTVTTSDGKASEIVIVEQEGIKENLSVSPGKLSFLPEANQSKKVTINATGKWKITAESNVDWLNYDSEGSGNTTIEIATKYANESAKPRSVDLVVSLTSNNTIRQTISVTQDPLYSDICVKPADWVSVYDELYQVYEITWEYAVEEKGKNTVNQFRYMILPESDLQNWTKKEIIRELEKKELLKFSLGWISTLIFDSNKNLLQANTSYHYFSIAYDENDNPGDLYEDVIKTPTRANATDDAYVGFANLSLLSENSYSFLATPEGRTKKFHIIYGNNNDDINLGAAFAFQINYYLKYNKKHWYTELYGLDIQTDYPNAHQFIHYAPTNVPLYAFPMITGWGWGVYENGKRSTCVTGFDIDISSTDVKEYKKIRGKNAQTSKRPLKNVYDIRKSDILKQRKE